MSSDTRLIERWLPIAELGIESVRERKTMTALPPTYYLHVWWARRPLVAARAAILGSILRSDADRRGFLDALGIHGDPLAARRRIELADRRGERLGSDAYGYKRAFTYTPEGETAKWIREHSISANSVVLDPTAGGGSIPYEAVRLGLPAIGNDLNPVAGTILTATFKWPAILGTEIAAELQEIGPKFVEQVRSRLAGIFPEEPEPDCRPDGYLFARTVTCPYCDGLIPLSPNWRLSPRGFGVKVTPHTSSRMCTFEVVTSLAEHSEGTISDGTARCPYPDCNRIVDGTEIKSQARQGRMGEQLYTVVYKRKIVTGYTASGKEKVKWERGFRTPIVADDRSEVVRVRLDEKLSEWLALDYIPSESFPEGTNDDRPLQYGMPLWRDMFSPRQLLCHGTCVQVFREMLEADRRGGKLTECRRAAYVYLALGLDKLRDYNSRMTRWHANREVVVNTFDRHDFSFKWSYCEMAPLVPGLGFDWVVSSMQEAVEGLTALIDPSKKKSAAKPDRLPMFDSRADTTEPKVLCTSADALNMADGSVDVVVMDPPYYNNVMYAELSDFFYVWLKRTAGYVLPELFRTSLTDKEHEAVANPARFKNQKGSADTLASRDYQQKMAAIFAECHRVLKPNGIMTLMFTHKATGAWDALTKGLMQAGFTITASWPINTEAEGSLHIKDKAAANSTIFLVCRPRAERPADEAPSYWEDVEPLVAGAVRERIKEFQDAGIGGVDLYLASFGPALQKFSEHWPLRRGTPRPQPEVRKRKKQAEMFEEEWDPYEVTPEDALDAARREVKRWRLQQLTHMKARTDLDPLTSFYVLAWDAFKAPKFDYDEALRLARAVGVDLEKDIIGHVAEKKASDITLWDSAKRAAKGALGPADGSRSWLDAVHHAAYAARSRNLQHAREMLEKAQVASEAGFFAALEAVLEVLPVSKAFSGIDLEGDVKEFGSDFEALENLRKLAFSEDVDEPTQIEQYRLEFAEASKAGA